MARVTLQQLRKIYRDSHGADVEAVKGIDLEIRDGEFMVLVGPSGCGKSTTLRMIAGLEPISGGTLQIDDRVVNDVAPKDRDIAMVFQNYALYPHLSVFDNLAFGLKLRKLPKPEIAARVREAAALLGLEPLLDRKPKALSGGQRQRVAVGRAIVRHPKVFLFDEPLSNLDAKMRVSMRAEISKLHDRLRATVIYVTHDQVEAMTMGDRICVMHDGAVMQVATPLDLYHRPANLFVAGFIGSPPMNLFHGTIETDAAGGSGFVPKSADAVKPRRIALDDRLGAAARRHVGRAVVLGLRPEDLTNVPPSTAGASGSLEATLELVESMGAETYLHFSAGGANCVARVRGSGPWRSGDRITLWPDWPKAHLFDAATGAALS